MPQRKDSVGLEESHPGRDYFLEHETSSLKKVVYVDLAGLPPIRAVVTLFMDHWVYFTPICGVKTCVYFAGNTCFFMFFPQVYTACSMTRNALVLNSSPPMQKTNNAWRRLGLNSTDKDGWFH